MDIIRHFIQYIISLLYIMISTRFKSSFRDLMHVKNLSNTKPNQLNQTNPKYQSVTYI